MRFLHTADWHLGRILHGVRLVDDQAHVLGQLCRLAAEEKLDAVLISGDVYDRAVPPPDAVELLDDTLARLSLGLGLPVVLMAGNHDSARRLGFGARMLAKSGVHVAGPCPAEAGAIVLGDEHGPVHVHALAHAEPAEVRAALADDTAQTHDSALAARLVRLPQAPAGARRVLMAHVFAAGAGESESERPLSVGGSGAVDPARLRGFDYTALGHLHRPQSAGAEHVRYAGSLLKYSFSEAAQPKSVNIVELGPPGEAPIVRQIALTPRRDLRIISGAMAKLLEQGPADPGRLDYVQIILEDEGPIFDAMARLREAYPNALQLRRAHLEQQPRRLKSARHLAEADIFAAFISQTTGREPNAEEAAAFRRALAAVHAAEDA